MRASQQSVGKMMDMSSGSGLHISYIWNLIDITFTEDLHKLGCSHID